MMPGCGQGSIPMALLECRELLPDETLCGTDALEPESSPSQAGTAKFTVVLLQARDQAQDWCLRGSV